MGKYIKQALDYIESTPKEEILKELESIEVNENDVIASDFVEESMKRIKKNQ